MVWKFSRLPPQAWIASDEVFSADELAKIVNLPKPETVGAIGCDVVDKGIRDSRVRFIAPSPETEWLYRHIEGAFKFANDHFHLNLAGMGQLQLTAYEGDSAGHYGAHTDNGYGEQPSNDRKLSMTVQLSDAEEYDGGELLLYPHNLNPVTMPKRKGLTTFFRSHVIHEVRPVTKGTRLSLVAWAFGPVERM
jgi:PKHD-type hydroxylase